MARKNEHNDVSIDDLNSFFAQSSEVQGKKQGRRKARHRVTLALVVIALLIVFFFLVMLILKGQIPNVFYWIELKMPPEVQHVFEWFDKTIQNFR